MDLNSLARTLAERLCDDTAVEVGGCDYSPDIHVVEAVIREAIDKTLQIAEQAVMDEAVANLHEAEPPNRECQVCTGLTIGAAAIRSLKQSNSGIVRK